jgi:flagellar basal body-associated protein FliL
MKSKDIFVIVLIGIFSAVVSVVISNTFISSEKSRNETAEVIPVISSELQRPPEQYFNSNSINPTQIIQIGGEASTQPFGNQ